MYKLLIVDDEIIIRRGIKNLIALKELEIIEVLEASDGNQALELINANNPDIVLLDINMPNLDGLSLAKIAKEKYPNTYIIIITGYDYFEYMQKAIRAKVDDYILKPVSKKDIEYILKKAINNLKTINLSNEINAINQKDIKINNKSNVVEEYLNKNVYCSKLSLNKMSTDIGYSSNYLSVLIKETYGMSFQDYINKKRMEKAKLLLLSTDKKNYEIATEVGIEDVNYFITKFKKYYDITPKQFKQGLK